MASEAEQGSSQSLSKDQAFPAFYRRDQTPATSSSGSERKGLSGSRGGDEDRVEYPPMPEKKKLGYFSTSSLIVSKMIGTGIFMKPATVFLDCGGKSVALGLWVGGGLMTLCGVLIYLEWGIALPFNGAEIVYIEEAYPTPKYLAVIIVSLLFVLCNHCAGNCIGFAKLILQAFEPDQPNPDYRLQKFVALVMLTSVCLLHVFSRKLGIVINNFLAVYKLGLVAFVVLTGFVAMAGGGKGATKNDSGYGLENFRDIGKVQRMSMNQYSNAILGVLWAYTGWENANYVLAEVKRPPGKESKVFKVAALGSIGAITTLYVLANVAYFTVLTNEEIAEEGNMIAIKFFLKVFGNGWFIERGMRIMISLSVLGNFISYTYGMARVKQEIAKLRILPFSKFWARQSHYDTPVGALFLHWIFASLVIVVTPNNENDDAYNLITDLFVNAQNWIIATVSLGIFSLRYHSKFRAWKPHLMSWNILIGIVSIYVPLNLFVILLTWWPPEVQTSIPSYVTPGVASAIIVFGFFYWIVFAKALPAIGYHIDSEPDELIDGSRVVMYKRYKTGFAKRVSDWIDKNVLRKKQ